MPADTDAGGKAVVLVSGGLDSATVLALAAATGVRCYALTFDYGQRHRVELDAARRVAQAQRAADHRVVKLDIGWMASDGEDRVQREYHGADPDWLVKAAAALPFGRLLDPAEVARAVAFLASDDSGMMTGSVVHFDQSVWGGYDAGPPTPAGPLSA